MLTKGIFLIINIVFITIDTHTVSTFYIVFYRSGVVNFIVKKVHFCEKFQNNDVNKIHCPPVSKLGIEKPTIIQ